MHVHCINYYLTTTKNDLKIWWNMRNENGWITFSNKAFFFFCLICGIMRCDFLLAEFWNNREGEEAEASVCGGEGGGRVWRVQRKLGSGRVDSAVVRGIGMSVHSATIDLSRTWTTRQGLPALEVATSRLRSSQVSHVWFKFLAKFILMEFIVFEKKACNSFV